MRERYEYKNGIVVQLDVCELQSGKWVGYFTLELHRYEGVTTIPFYPEDEYESEADARLGAASKANFRADHPQPSDFSN